ncbi:MAG: hypothetical protein V4617_02685 [Gemmatimonadota bacterium]
MINVLVLEDDAVKLSRIARVLSDRAGVASSQIMSASDAATARRLLTQTHFDLLVLDLVVPARLGEAAAESVGFDLLEDLFDDSDLRMPEQIVGLTGFAKVEREYAARFSEFGVALVHYDERSEAWEGALEMRVRQVLARRAAVESTPRSHDAFAGVICALALEFEALQRLWTWRQVQVPGDPSLYFETTAKMGTIERRLVASICPRMGMSSAAITATKLINEFRPSYLAMTGITAGVRDQVQIGHVIGANQTWDWGMGKWDRDKQSGELRFRPSPHQLALDSTIDGALRAVSLDAAFLASVRTDWPAAKPSAALELMVGSVASGAAVIAAQSMTEQIAAHQRKLLGIDMEVYGVFAAAAEAAAPAPKAFALKGVCDYADEDKDGAWQHYAAFASARIFKRMVEQELS